MENLNLIIIFTVIASLTVGNVISLYEMKKYKSICLIGLFGIPFYIITYFIIITIVPKINPKLYRKYSFYQKVRLIYAVTLVYMHSYRESTVLLAESFLRWKRFTTATARELINNFKNFLRKEWKDEIEKELLEI